ncbi:MAG: hypothetical protein ACK559_30950, partial [bacterium]
PQKPKNITGEVFFSTRVFSNPGLAGGADWPALPVRPLQAFRRVCAVPGQPAPLPLALRGGERRLAGQGGAVHGKKINK